MAQRENGRNRREQYRRTQGQKKRPERDWLDETQPIEPALQMEDSLKKKGRVSPSMSKEERKRVKKETKQNLRLNRKRAGKVARTTGVLLFMVQISLSAILFILLCMLDMLTANYLLLIGCILIAASAVTLITQLSRHKRGIIGKIFAVCMSFILGFSSFYVWKTYDTIEKVTGGNYKVDKMVVAVLKNDPAEAIEDAEDYTFGVQYAKDKTGEERAISSISEKLNTQISTQEYESMNEQAQALHDGDVKAIIYNDAYTSILEEVFNDYSDSVKVIYSQEVKTELQDLTIDVSVQSEPFSVYISGIDVYGDIATSSRSDVNIIATVNPKTHQVLLVTTPRDYYVPIPGESNGAGDKLTHAGVYGVDASMNTLGALYEFEIPFYARVNFTSLIEIVDTLGGVDVESEFEFRTSKDSEYVMDVQKGTNHFDGEQALAFCRERQNLADGDNQRGKNQQAVITAIIQKMLSPSMLTKASSLMDSVAGNVDTNMAQEQINALVKQQLRENATWHIYSVAAEGSGAEKTCYSSGSTPLYVTIPDEESVSHIEDLINRVEAGEILEDSVAAKP